MARMATVGTEMCMLLSLSGLSDLSWYDSFSLFWKGGVVEERWSSCVY